MYYYKRYMKQINHFCKINLEDLIEIKEYCLGRTFHI